MPTENDREKRQSIIDACLRMNALGINQGTSGNISLRHGEGLLVTPTSTPYEAMQPEQIVYMHSMVRTIRPSARRANGGFTAISSRPAPTSTPSSTPTRPTRPCWRSWAWRFRRCITWSPAPAATPSAARRTRPSAPRTLRTCRSRARRQAGLPAQHHGMIAIGPSLSKAMWLAVEVETLARQYHGCLQIGTPPLLSKEEIEKVRVRMAGYGHAEE